MSIPHPAFLTLPDGSTCELGASCALGRASGNDVVLEGQKVSRRHAVIHQQGSREFWLIDLGSSNGTLHNDHPVIQPIHLEDGDRLSVGGNLLRFHAPAVGSGITADDTVAESTLRQVTVTPQWMLVADLAGFTPLSRSLPADELARVVGRWFSNCREIIDTHKGQVNKYLGDGFLAVWPDLETSPENVSRSLEELYRIRSSDPTLSFRLATHYGPVSMGRVMDGGELSLMGPDVNFLFRMEKLAADLDITCLLSEAASGHLGRDSRALGNHALKGFEGDYAFFAWEPGS